MDINRSKKIHFVGICGIGLSGLATICLEIGKIVSGSDISESIVTEGLRKAGAKIIIGKQKESNVPDDIDLLVYSNAVPKDNPERKKAVKMGVDQLSYPQALGQLTRDKKLICISGTHGKTTTTAMAVSVFKAAGFDASFIVGSYLQEIGGNAHWGQSEYFIIEADEYSRAMLNYFPDYLILTNIEADHLDTYKNINDIKDTFRKYLSNLSGSGALVANIEDKNIKEISSACQAKILYYGLKHGDIKPAWLASAKKGCSFGLGKIQINLSVPGLHNVSNALGVFALAKSLGIEEKLIKKGLEDFKGTWRRFEHIGDFNNLPVISDYAHHPTEIRALLSAARQVYPKKRIVIIFQPHQHNRTKNLFKEFTKCFDQADLIILNEIFDVAGREGGDDQDVSSQDLVREIKKRNRWRLFFEKFKKEVYYAKDLKESEEMIRKMAKRKDVLLIAGAGEIYKVGKKLTNS
ncbi:MAG: UDP-N-acetylmuramate--L-alanine ligase [Patescibacteria group bacterium]